MTSDIRSGIGAIRRAKRLTSAARAATCTRKTGAAVGPDCPDPGSGTIVTRARAPLSLILENQTEHDVTDPPLAIKNSNAAKRKTEPLTSGR